SSAASAPSGLPRKRVRAMSASPNMVIGSARPTKVPNASRMTRSASSRSASSSGRIIRLSIWLVPSVARKSSANADLRLAAFQSASPRREIWRIPRGLKLLRHFLGEVGQDQVGTGAADAGEYFHDRALLVEPAVDARGADHRVFARDVVGGDRHPKFVFYAPDQIEVR